MTGSQSNVRNAYMSGTPAIGVGAGNVPVIIDESADLAGAADKIARSKTFDYATSCSSENSLVILESVYEATVEALRREGAYLLNEQQKRQLETVMFAGGKLSQKIIAQSPDTVAANAGFDEPAARSARFFLAEETQVGDEAPLSGEKLSVVLRSTVLPISMGPWLASKRSSRTREQGIRAVSIPPRTRTRAGWRMKSTWSACSSTSRTASITAAHLTTA